MMKPKTPQTAHSRSSTNLVASLSNKRDGSNSEGLFGRVKYKLWAFTAITFLALWSMFTGSVTLKLSAVNIKHSSEGLDNFIHGDLDILGKKMVRQMWNAYKHSSIVRLPSFWRDAFGAAFQDLTSKVASVRNADLLEIAKMSFRSHNLYHSSPLDSIARFSKDIRPSKKE